MITEIFSSIGDVITGFMGNLATAVNSVSSLVWQPAETGSGGTLTTFGTLLLLSAGVGVCYWLFKMVRRLIHAA